MEIQITLSKEVAVLLEDLNEKLDKVISLGKASLKDKDFDEDENIASKKEESSEDDDFATTKKPVKKAKGFDDEDGEVEAAAESDEEEFEAPTKKKAKKLTVDDVNDACKERATDEGGGKVGRSAVLAILKKKFKVTSVTDLDEKQYAAVISAMKS